MSLADGRVFNAHLTAIAGVGRAVMLQDITHLKKLDRIKSDFVTTVSHDLRSPLTAILGYVELIARAGPVNDQQAEFIRRASIDLTGRPPGSRGGRCRGNSPVWRRMLSLCGGGCESVMVPGSGELSDLDLQLTSF